MIEKFLHYVAAAVVLTIAYYSWPRATGSTLTLWEALSPTTTAVTAWAILGFVFNHWGWRLLPRFAARRVFVQGTWRVALTSSYDGEAASRVGFLVLRQTWSKVRAHFITAGGESHTLACELRHEEDVDQFVLHAVYRNQPRLRERNSVSQMHLGGMELKVRVGPPATLDGHYWTDREPQSKGTMTCTERKPELVDCYEAGLRLYGLSGESQPEAAGASGNEAAAAAA